MAWELVLTRSFVTQTNNDFTISYGEDVNDGDLLCMLLGFSGTAGGIFTPSVTSAPAIENTGSPAVAMQFHNRIVAGEEGMQITSLGGTDFDMGMLAFFRNAEYDGTGTNNLDTPKGSTTNGDTSSDPAVFTAGAAANAVEQNLAIYCAVGREWADTQALTTWDVGADGAQIIRNGGEPNGWSHVYGDGSMAMDFAYEVRDDAFPARTSEWTTGGGTKALVAARYVLDRAISSGSDHWAWAQDTADAWDEE